MFRQAFISYRGRDYALAERAAAALVDRGWCGDFCLLPPNSLAEEGELFLPLEFVELMGFIRDRLSGCDAFVFVNTPHYADSYFTQAELLQWRCYRDPPTVYAATIGANGRVNVQPHKLEPASRNTKTLWAKIAVGIDRSQQGHMSVPLACGPYAKNCFLVPCHKCGEHFLLGKEAVAAAVRGAFRVSCPHGCGNASFSLRETSGPARYYRRPIVLSQAGRARMRVLGEGEILTLLVGSELPPGFPPPVSASGEVFRSDLAKLGMVYGGLAAVAVALIGGAAILDSLRNKGRS